jgi:hypothetical protein
MSELRQDVIVQLRDMARRRDSVGNMFRVLKKHLGPDATIVTMIEYMRSAFCLSLTEVKPVAALSRTDQREVVDEGLLQQLVMPEIDKHRREWET